ncbi:MAG: hypothetical protein HYU36_02100 [Planctomycetes bacterium]|nr:hypothetical protein [Planctomycetota bacterium]
MSTRDANRTKKWRTCLKCGRRLYTDRCHRICPKCHQKNENEGRIRRVGIGTSHWKAGDSSLRAQEKPNES